MVRDFLDTNRLIRDKGVFQLKVPVLPVEDPHRGSVGQHRSGVRVLNIAMVQMLLKKDLVRRGDAVRKHLVLGQVLFPVVVDEGIRRGLVVEIDVADVVCGARRGIVSFRVENRLPLVQIQDR